MQQATSSWKAWLLTSEWACEGYEIVNDGRMHWLCVCVREMFLSLLHIAVHWNCNQVLDLCRRAKGLMLSPKIRCQLEKKWAISINEKNQLVSKPKAELKLNESCVGALLKCFIQFWAWSWHVWACWAQVLLSGLSSGWSNTQAIHIQHISFHCIWIWGQHVPPVIFKKNVPVLEPWAYTILSVWISKAET